MAAVRLPDGRELPIEPGEKARDVAEKIGKRLARDAVVAKLNGELIDLDAPLDGGGDFAVVRACCRSSIADGDRARPCSDGCAAAFIG